MNITNEAVERIYTLCRDVEDNRMSRSEALVIVRNEGFMTEGSARIYLSIFHNILTGKVYHRAMNARSYEYFLSSIYQDYGFSAYKKAIAAVKEHFSYYNSLGKGVQRKAEMVVEKLIQKLPLTDAVQSYFPDEVPDAEAYFEGASRKVSINVYERNPIAREKCIHRLGVNCFVCDFNFERTYGLIGSGFIHVHHLKSLAEIGEEYEVDPLKDLIPVCPNCHAMLHRPNAPSVDGLRKLIKERASR